MKKGFTLGEILIVLMILSFIFVLTVPSLVKNTNGAQTKTALKRGFASLANAYMSEFVTRPAPQTKEDTDKIINMINDNLNIKYYLNCNGSKCEEKYNKSEQNLDSWIVTEDFVAYKIIQGGSNCIDKATLNQISNSKDATEASCFAIIIDSGCITKKKDKSECTEIEDGTAELAEKIKKNKFTGNQMRAFVSSTGVASGNTDTVAAGIIASQD